jgi:hypothetical protein
LVPFSNELNKSDVARILALIRQPAQARPWMALWAIQTQETRGVLPRNWDPELVRQALMATPSSSEYTYIQLLAFYRSTNQKQEQAALEHLENALARSSNSSKVFRQCLSGGCGYESSHEAKCIAGSHLVGSCRSCQGTSVNRRS